MININRLSISYGKIKVLENLNVDFEKGGIHGIAGLNGAGKTTLFNAIYGFIKCKPGSILINQQSRNRKYIAYLEAQHFFYSNLTGNDYLWLFPDGNARFDIEKWNQLLHLPLQDLIETYSTGMKKKLALLALLKQDKAYYLFDEPFNGLDLEATQILKIIIKQLKSKNKTVLISSHIWETLTAVCDKIYFLNRGSFEFCKTADKFDELEAHIFNSINQKGQQFISELI